jgi:two-component system cell cycle sensor histidine kinase/response regulator CckA
VRADPNGPTVLVVDDDEGLLHSLSRVLTRAGFQVLEAGNVVEARARVEEKKPDIVLMDLILPGMEGREVANLIHVQHPDIPVVYMSGYTTAESVRMGTLTQGEPFLRKPFTGAELLEEIEAALLDGPTT